LSNSVPRPHGFGEDVGAAECVNEQGMVWEMGRPRWS
jgi:hypothetical protein